jgi:hypothetical protein
VNESTKHLWTWFGLALTVVASGYFSFVPVYSSFSSGIVVDSGTAFSQGEISGNGTLASVNGSSTYIMLAIPVLLAAAPLFTRQRSYHFVLNAVAAVLIGALAVVGAASIGLFYLPAALLLVVATIRSWELRSRAV